MDDQSWLLDGQQETIADTNCVDGAGSDFDGTIEKLDKPQTPQAELTSVRARVIHSIIREMRDCAFVVDADRNLIAANDAARQFLSLSKIATTAAVLPDAKPTFEDALIAGCLRGEPIDNLERQLLAADGSRRHFIFSGTPVRNQKGEPELVIVMGRDVTDMKHLHAKTQEKLDRITNRHIEQLRAQQRIEEFYRREHRIAENLQLSFFSQELPQTRGFEIGHHYKAALDEANVGGDFYDLFPLGGNCFGVVIADAAGKGLKAAVYTAMTKYMLRAYALEDKTPETVLARLNDAMSACTPEEVFVTLIYGVLDVDGKTFVYANAGHEPLILYSSAQRSAAALDLTGHALALQQGSQYVAQSVRLEPGDVLLLYTDGLTDAGWGEKRMGHDRVLDLVENSASQPAHVLAELLIAAATNFAGGKLDDDAAILIIRRPQN